MARATLWNANTHYHRILIDALPSAAQRVLDVGCGDGILAAELVEAGVSRVVALDSDAAVLARAQARHHGLPIEWMHGDIFNLPAPVEVLFDAVFSVATLHHFDAAAGLTRFAELTRPGGVVGVIGLAANDWWDLPYAAFGRIVQRTVGMIRGYWEHSAPTMWPPPATYREMKRIAPRAFFHPFDTDGSSITAIHLFGQDQAALRECISCETHDTVQIVGNPEVADVDLSARRSSVR